VEAACSFDERGGLIVEEVVLYGVDGRVVVVVVNQKSKTSVLSRRVKNWPICSVLTFLIKSQKPLEKTHNIIDSHRCLRDDPATAPQSQLCQKAEKRVFWSLKCSAAIREEAGLFKTSSL
jgi:hypothetical protein